MGMQNAKGDHPSAKEANQLVLETQKRVGKRIRALRESRKLTRERLSQMADFSAKHLGEVERGTSNISLELLTKVSVALGVQLASIMDNDYEQTKCELVDEINLMAPQLSEKDAKTVYRLIKMLTNQ